MEVGEKRTSRKPGRKQSGDISDMRVMGGHKIPGNEARVQRELCTKPSGI